ncbi:hypothetical protein CLOM_g19281 [Closterium sp. NIES-68]|nr:hypothetical protein CLOM_g19281 [Closterium sp. NIES-68]GJP80429.1 hypothetical protein CLOP_g10632 [Closterium sp. NIES-67]
MRRHAPLWHGGREGLQQLQQSIPYAAGNEETASMLENVVSYIRQLQDDCSGLEHMLVSTSPSSSTPAAAAAAAAAAASLPVATSNVSALLPPSHFPPFMVPRQSPPPPPP